VGASQFLGNRLIKTLLLAGWVKGAEGREPFHSTVSLAINTVPPPAPSKTVETVAILLLALARTQLKAGC
jgi:hypothetical protein